MKFERLGDITKNLDSRRIPLNSEQRISKSKKGLYPYIGANNIVGYIDEYIFDEKILCIAEDGGSWGTNQQCAIIYEGKTWVNNHAHVLVENGKANLDFLRCYLNLTNLNKYIKGATRGKLNKSVLENILIPLPSLQGQIQIANILSKAETLIEQRKESIALLDEFLKSTFLEMFGDAKNNEKGFQIKNLTEFYINPKEGTKCGPFGSALKKDEYTESGIQVWTMDNILKSGEFVENGCLFVSEIKHKELERYDARNGDIIISRAGTVGKMCIIKTDKKISVISSNLIRLRLGKYLLPIYFLSLMRYCQSRIIKLKHGNEDSYTHMSTGILDEINFPYPPIELQTQFANIVSKTETLKEQYKNSLQELENLYGSLSQKAFKGELEFAEVKSVVANVISLPALQPVEEKYFLKRKVLATYIINESLNDTNFGDVKFEKILYLSDYFAIKRNLGQKYYQQTAGPYDNAFTIQYFPQVINAKWFNRSKDGKQFVFSAGQQHAKSTSTYNFFSTDELQRVNEIISYFKKYDYEQPEIVSTLYAVWNNRIILQEQITNDLLIDDFYKWDEQKKKYERSRLEKALTWMRNKNFIPDGWGKMIKKAKKTTR